MQGFAADGSGLLARWWSTWNPPSGKRAREPGLGQADPGIAELGDRMRANGTEAIHRVRAPLLDLAAAAAAHLHTLPTAASEPPSAGTSGRFPWFPLDRNHQRSRRAGTKVRDGVDGCHGASVMPDIGARTTRFASLTGPTDGPVLTGFFRVSATPCLSIRLRFQVLTE